MPPVRPRLLVAAACLLVLAFVMIARFDDLARMAVASSVALLGTPRIDLSRLPEATWALAALVLTVVVLFALLHVHARTTLARWLRADGEEERIASLREQMSARRQRGGYSVSTAMPDRPALVHWLDQTITHARLTGNGCSVLLVQVSNLPSGLQDDDDLLAQDARALAQAVLDPHDCLARLGPDAFAVGVPAPLDPPRAQALGTRIVSAMQARMAGRGVPSSAPDELGVSIGIAVFPHDAQTPEGLLRAARLSLGEARESGANQIRLFSAAAGERAQRVQVIRRDLWRAIQDETLSLHFQPKYDVRQRTVLGAEALCRWRHPALGMVDPIEFLSVAEQSGRIDGLDDWVIASVCRQVRQWQDAGLPQLPVAINVSGPRFASPGFAAYVLDQVHHHDIPPASITLEIADTAAMRDVGRSLEALEALQVLGIEVALDDFGSEHAILGYLKRLPVGTLKIDRALIAGLDRDDDGRAIVGSMISLAHQLRMTVVAEGVETSSQFDMLAELGCDHAQGYLLSPPVDAAAYAGMLAGLLHRPA